MSPASYRAAPPRVGETTIGRLRTAGQTAHLSDAEIAVAVPALTSRLSRGRGELADQRRNLLLRLRISGEVAGPQGGVRLPLRLLQRRHERAHLFRRPGA